MTSYKHVRKEIAIRLKELRLAKGYVSTGRVQESAAARGIKLPKRTITEWEHETGVCPQVDNLAKLLDFYGMTLGDFFRFTLVDEEQRLIGEFVHVIQDPKYREALRNHIAAYRDKISSRRVK